MSNQAQFVSNEIWKRISGYPDYLISSHGNLQSKKSGEWRKINGTLNAMGYLVMSLRKDNKTYPFSIHRLVGLHFLETHPDKRIINHLDTNKQNNHYSNLEWCNHSTNLKHAYATTRKSFSGADNKKFGQKHTYKTSKIVIDLCNGIFYDNVGEAAKYNNIKRESLRNYLDGRRENKTNLIYA